MGFGLADARCFLDCVLPGFPGSSRGLEADAVVAVAEVVPVGPLPGAETSLVVVAVHGAIGPPAIPPHGVTELRAAGMRGSAEDTRRGAVSSFIGRRLHDPLVGALCDLDLLVTVVQLPPASDSSLIGAAAAGAKDGCLLVQGEL